MYVTASKLNVRAYPSTDEHGTILGKLSYGDAVTVTGKSNKLVSHQVSATMVSLAMPTFLANT